MGANRLLKVVLAAVMVAGPLALGAGVPATAAPSAAASPRLAAWAVTADFPVDDSLVLAVNPQSHTVYAGGQDENEFSVINGVTGKLTGTIPAPAGANQGAVNPATNTLYVSTAQSIVAINAQTGQVIMTIPDSHDPGLPVVDEATNTIYVANASGIWVIDGSTNTVTGTIDLSSRVGGMALDQLTGTLYVADLDSSDVSVINTSTNSVTTTVDVGQFPRFVTVDPVTDKVYVDNQGDHSVSVIDGATNTVTATVDLEAEGGLVADPQTDTIYAADFAGEVRAIDGRTNDIVISLAPGQDFESSDGSLSHGLAIDPAAGILYSIDVFLSSDNPDTTVLSVITSCRGHIALAPGGGCAGVGGGGAGGAGGGCMAAGRGELCLAGSGRGRGHRGVPGHGVRPGDDDGNGRRRQELGLPEYAAGHQHRVVRAGRGRLAVHQRGQRLAVRRLAHPQWRRDLAAGGAGRHVLRRRGGPGDGRLEHFRLRGGAAGSRTRPAVRRSGWRGEVDSGSGGQRGRHRPRRLWPVGLGNRPFSPVGVG